MAKNDPNYVRLVDRLARGTRVDISTGWSISGLDVVEFPSDDYPRAQDYVRTELGRGTLEPASQAEFDEIMDNDTDFLSQAGVEVSAPKVEGHYQEAHVVGAANQRRRTIEESRFGGESSLSYRDDHMRRRRILAEQNGEDPADVTGDYDGEGEGVADGDKIADTPAASGSARRRTKKEPVPMPDGSGS